MRSLPSAGVGVAADKIDFAVGFEQPKKIGDAVKAGEPLMIMHYNDEMRAAEAEHMVHERTRSKTNP